MKKEIFECGLILGTLLALGGCRENQQLHSRSTDNSVTSKVKSSSKNSGDIEEKDSSSVTSSSNTQSSKNQSLIKKSPQIAGDDGELKVPTEIQGRWYLANAETGDITTVVFGKSWITYDDKYTTELHKKKEGFDALEYGRIHADYEQKTQNWSEASNNISKTGTVKMNVSDWNECRWRKCCIYYCD